MRAGSVEFSSEELRQFNHVAFVAPSSAASFSLFLSLSLVLWMRGKVGGMSSIDAALGSFQHQESYLQGSPAFASFSSAAQLHLSNFPNSLRSAAGTRWRWGGGRSSRNFGTQMHVSIVDPG